MQKQHYTYPSGTTIRNLIYNSLQRQQHILRLVSNQDNLPPWVLMLVSRATNDLNTVDEFVNYYYNIDKTSNTLNGFEDNFMEELKKHYTTGSMIRNLLTSSHFRQTHILSIIKDNMDVPPWIVYKVSRATGDLNTVDDFLTSYYLDI
jgi:hypothetical protein